MKKAGKINLISFWIIIFSIIFWQFFWGRLEKTGSFGKDFFKEKKVLVEGEKDFNFFSASNNDPTFQNLAFAGPTFNPVSGIFANAPKKKDGYGEIYIRAHASISIDAATETILHYNRGKERRAIASLTKIMTAILVIENIKNLEKEIVTIDQEAVYAEGTTIGCPNSARCVSNTLYSGERVYAQNLLEAMLINSANDAAIALAKHIAGSQKKFAEMMNEKARQLGLKDTNFCNPSGLDEEDNPGNCYSTAYDFARIVAYALQYNEIWNILKIKKKEFYSVDGDWTHTIFNTDILLDQMPNCVGGKTGFTYEAGKSLMMVAHHPQNPKHKVIGVILNDEYRWEDMKNLLNWSFEAYQWPEEKK